MTERRSRGGRTAMRGMWGGLDDARALTILRWLVAREEWSPHAALREAFAGDGPWRLLKSDLCVMRAQGLIERRGGLAPEIYEDREYRVTDAGRAVLAGAP